MDVATLTSIASEAGRRLGYQSMKPEQVDVVVKILQGRDVFAILPTGFGKSLCYACLPSAFDILLKQESGHSLVIVVTPLLAIVKDQTATYSSKGVSCTSISGAGTNSQAEWDVAGGKYQLVFFTPEVIIGTRRWRKVLEGDVYAERLKVFVIDEAHCVKKWGDTFRPVLSRVGEVRSLVPRSVRVLALTATATKSDRLDVSRTLGLRNPYVLAKCPAKTNVIYHAGSFQGIEETFQPFAEQLVLKRNQFPKTIIYGRTFGICADIYLYLKKCLGVAFTYPQDAPDLPDFRLVEMFTSVTECKHKSKILELFKTKSSLRVVVATIAFGMGVDCPDIRQIVHIGVPDDIGSYIQEIGRAGRDGLLSVATLLHSRVYHKVDEDIKMYAANSTDCRRKVLFGDMDNYVHVDIAFKCLCCDICAKLCACGQCKLRLSSFVLFRV